MKYTKVKVQHLSMQELEGEGIQLGTDIERRNMEGRVNNEYLLSVLTNRQRTVADLLDKGYTRQEIALELVVCIQAIHQIVLRIRKRLEERADVIYDTKRGKHSGKIDDNTEQVLLLLLITEPGLTSELIYGKWEKHIVLREYPRPSYKRIKELIHRLRYGKGT